MPSIELTQHRIEVWTRPLASQTDGRGCALLRRRYVHNTHRNQTPFPIVERLPQLDPDVLRRVWRPALALDRAAFLGVSEPEHDVDSAPFSPRVTGILGDQLATDRRPDVSVAASLDLHRHIESAIADADV